MQSSISTIDLTPQPLAFKSAISIYVLYKCFSYFVKQSLIETPADPIYFFNFQHNFWFFFCFYFIQVLIFYLHYNFFYPEMLIFFSLFLKTNLIPNFRGLSDQSYFHTHGFDPVIQFVHPNVLRFYLITDLACLSPLEKTKGGSYVCVFQSYNDKNFVLE